MVGDGVARKTTQYNYQHTPPSMSEGKLSLLARMMHRVDKRFSGLGSEGMTLARHGTLSRGDPSPTAKYNCRNISGA